MGTKASAEGGRLAPLIYDLIAQGIPQNLLARLIGLDKGYWSRLVRDADRLEAFLLRRLTPEEQSLLRLIHQDPTRLEEFAELLLSTRQQKGLPPMVGKLMPGRHPAGRH